MFEYEVCDTTELQLESLVLFANALGYDPVYSVEGKLLRFRGDKYKAVGEKYMSVSRMITHHNQVPDLIWRHISTVNTSFSEFINDPGGEHMINLLFAGNCTIVETVKASWSHKKGFCVHGTKSNHSVRFMTKKLYKMYKQYVGE